MASFDKRYISVCDPAVSSTTYVHIHSKTISENVNTDYLQYGSIEDKSLSFIKSKNAYSGQITTNFRPWESRFFLRSFFGVPRSGGDESYYLTENYNSLNLKVANGDPNTVGVNDRFITLNYMDVLINKIDLDFKSKDFSTASFSYIAEDVTKINDLDVTYDLPDEETSMFYKIDITMTPSSGGVLSYDDVSSCKIAMNNGGTNDSYHVGNNEPATLRKKQQQSGVITFNYDGYSTDNFAVRLNDLDCKKTYTIYINIKDRVSDATRCSFTFNNCVATETKRDLNRARDASKSVMFIADLTDMTMFIKNIYV